MDFGSFMEDLHIKSELSKQDIEKEVSRLTSFYQIEDIKGIVSLLAQFPELLPSIKEAQEEIPKYFGSSPVKLEITGDYECFDPYGLLYLSIQVDAPPQEALNKLNSLQSNWFLKKNSDILNRMILDVEFRS